MAARSAPSVNPNANFRGDHPPGPNPVSYFSNVPQNLPKGVQTGDYDINRTVFKAPTPGGVAALKNKGGKIGFEGETHKSFLDLTGDELHALFDPIALEEAIPLMGTGDIIGFWGTDTGMDHFNRGVQGNSWFNHVDMIVRDPPEHVMKDFKIAPDPSNVYVFETNMDDFGGTTMYGIHLFMENYQRRTYPTTYVFWRRLVETKKGRGVDDYPGLGEMLKKARTLPYEKNPTQFMLGILHYSGEDLSSIFCSESVMWAFRTMGLVPQDLVCSNYMPVDFCHNLKPERIRKRMLFGRHEPERLLLL